ncbi:hypothetical protein B0T18DRAFT_10321 [Schizothecium vesticola]|uniref:Uncharacterized protein n=1 Tax=Schizothecium vesticola TaxID=314040 RepID=A0AA40F8N6_9PEZI|nr:hypothetical protein B0T18DRAFT_10321 [Schizothecium vesticola]
MHLAQDILYAAWLFFSHLLAQKASNGGSKQHPPAQPLLPLHPTSSSTRGASTPTRKRGEENWRGASLTPRHKKRFTPHLSSQPFFLQGWQMRTGGHSWVACAKPCSFGQGGPAGGVRGVKRVPARPAPLGGGAASDLTGPPTTGRIPFLPARPYCGYRGSSLPIPATPPPPPEARVSSEAGNAARLTREHVDLDLWAAACWLGGRSAGRSATGPEAGGGRSSPALRPDGRDGTGKGR